MDPSAPSYVERQADLDLLDALLAGEYVFLLDSRQKGKSSLVARAIVQLKERGVATVKLDLQRIGANVTPEQWYAGLLVAVGEDLGLGEELFDCWGRNSNLGPLARWIGAIRHVVLPRVKGQVVFFIDEVDFVQALPFSTDEFFAGIRDCYNRRADDSAFGRLSFCIVGVATPGQLVRNPEITPFNIGRRIELRDFTLEESAVFAKALDALGKDGAQILARVHHWLSGHPYLTQLLCVHLAADAGATSARDVDAMVRRLFFTPESRQREPNLYDVERRLLAPNLPGMSDEEQRTQVLELYGQVLRGKLIESTENPIVASLRLSGVGFEDRQALRVRNRVYRIVFDEKWRRNSLPHAELRRQRGAARVALVRTAAVALVVIGGVTSVAINTNRLARDREDALNRLSVKTDDLDRVSRARQAALQELQGKSDDLNRESDARQKALVDLRDQAAAVTRLSDARAHALESLQTKSRELEETARQREAALKQLTVATGDLEATAEDLRVRNYVGRMARIQNDAANGLWSRVASQVEELKGSPYRGWEWGHLALQTSECTTYPLRNPRLEPTGDGGIRIYAEGKLYDWTPQGPAFRRKVADPHYWWVSTPTVRVFLQGDGRVLYRDARTDRTLGVASGRVWYLDTNAAGTATLLSTPAFDGDQTPFLLKSIAEDKVLATFKGPTWALVARFLPDGTILSVHKGGMICRRSMDDAILVQAQGPPVAGFGMHDSNRITLSDDGTLFAYHDGRYRRIEVRRTKDLSLVSTLEGPADVVYCLAFSTDNERVLTGSQDGTVRLFDARTGRGLRRFLGTTDMANQCRFVDDDRRVVVTSGLAIRSWTVAPSRDGAVQELPVSKHNLVYYEDLPGHEAAFALDSDEGGWGAFVHYDLRSGKTRRRDDLGSLDWVGGRLLAVCRNGKIQELSPRDFSEVRSVQVPESRPWVATSLLGGRRVLVEGDRPTAPDLKGPRYAVFDTSAFKVLRRFQVTWPVPLWSPSVVGNPATDEVALWADPPDGVSIGSGRGTTLQLVSTSTGRVVAERTFGGRRVFDLQFTPDGKGIYAIVNTAVDGVVRIVRLSAKTLQQEGELPAPALYVSLKIDPTGRKLLAWSDRGRSALYDLPTKRIVGWPRERIQCANFSPDGERLIFVNRPGRAEIWETSTGQELFDLEYTPRQGGAFLGQRPWDYCAFSADGRDVVLAGPDGVARIYRSLSWKSEIAKEGL